MKLIIKVNKEDLDFIKKTFTQDAHDYIPMSIRNCFVDAVLNGTPIPDNATNGDVIKAMFDTTEEHFYDEDRMVDVYGLDRSDDPSTFYADWWNGPYQKGGKE